MQFMALGNGCCIVQSKNRKHFKTKFSNQNQGNGKSMKKENISAKGALAKGANPSFVAIEIPKSDIEKMATGELIAVLMMLVDNPENVASYKESVAFRVTGYDDNVLPFEIPEVRSYFQEIFKEWPFFMWFMLRGFGYIPSYVFMLTELEYGNDKVGRRLVRPKKTSELSLLFIEHMARSSPTLLAMGASLEEILESIKSAFAELNSIKKELGE